MAEILHRRGTREINTQDMKVGQSAPITLDDGPIDREQVVLPVDTPLIDDYAKALSFAEEPVTIRVSPSAEKFAPTVIDCAVNGKGAEVFVGGRWHELGVIPVGREVTTKRKYVEVLARSKQDNVSTRIEQRTDGEENIVDRSTYHKAPFSVIEDRNPMGAEWLTRIMAEG